MIRILTLTTLSLLVAAAPLAQRAPAAETLLERWSAQQRSAHAAAEGFYFTEHVERAVDGRHGPRAIQYVQRVNMRGATQDAALVRATVDGEVVQSDRIAHMQMRLDRVFGPDLAAAGRLADLPPFLFGRLQTTAPLAAEHLGGAPVWRMELASRRPESTIDGATLWFARNGQRPVLLRSRLRVRGESPGAIFVITTDHAEVQGPAGPLAVPARQRIEGVVEQQRRWRTYSVTMSTERRFEELRVQWQRP
jgi:hypothetical protein